MSIISQKLMFTLKFNSHLHPITLPYSRIKDRLNEDKDDIFYSDACEEELKIV